MGFQLANLATSFERNFFLGYFLIHIPLTIFIDSAIVTPPKYQPCYTLIQWHIKNNNDFLMDECPWWFQAMVYFELVFQLPLFFYFLRNLKLFKETTTTKQNKGSPILLSDDKYTKSKLTSLKRWLRLYGWNASLTSLMCIIAIYHHGHYPLTVSTTYKPLSTADRYALIGFYFPTFLIPLRLCFLH